TPPPELSPLSLHDALPIWLHPPILTPPSATRGCRGIVGGGSGMATGIRTCRPAYGVVGKASGAEPILMPGSKFKGRWAGCRVIRSEEHTSELQSRGHLVCR